MTRSIVWTLLAISAALALPIARADDAPDASDANSSVLVTLTRLQEGSLPHVVVGYGTVEPAAAGHKTIMAPVAAVVASIEVRLGEEVPAGAALIRLAPSPATAASYTQAKSALSVAERLVASTRKLMAGHLATAQQLADAEKSESDARSTLQALDAVGAGGSHVIRAPFRAIVTALSTTPGSIVAEGAALLDLAAPQNLVLNVGVVPAQAAAIHANDQAAVQLIGASQTVPAKVLLCGAVAEADTGLVPVEIALPPGRFLPGEMAQAAITTAEMRGYVVPHEAVLVNDSGEPYVVQAVDGVAHKVPVSVLDAHGNQDVISGALDARAPLVLTGNHQLDDGMKVRLADSPQPQATVAGK
ncbi:MAG TPA: HlyD family efflux transporter periplasmic adaptor subunit [Steroidobacteraceae bacterium]|nr:HlyD family efflux transporter periplasmic adaptor subunit [Steroidobacteraceae bacterium]